jgi:hypothetical protein
MTAILWHHKEISWVVGMMTLKASPSLPKLKSPHFWHAPNFGYRCYPGSKGSIAVVSTGPYNSCPTNFSATSDWPLKQPRCLIVNFDVIFSLTQLRFRNRILTCTEAPATNWIRGWVDPRKKDNSWPYRYSNSDLSVVQPVASRYTDYTTPGPYKVNRLYNLQSLFSDLASDLLVRWRIVARYSEVLDATRFRREIKYLITCNWDPILIHTADYNGRAV